MCDGNCPSRSLSRQPLALTKASSWISLRQKARPVTGDPMALDEATRVARSESPVAVAIPSRTPSGLRSRSLY